VVVPGQLPKAVLHRQVETFVRRVPVLNNGRGLARWSQAICPVVTGMTQEQAEFVLLRLLQAAREAGAPTFQDGRCEANLYIIATAAPAAMVKALARRSPSTFAKLSATEFKDMETTPRAVRAWYNATIDRLMTGTESAFEGPSGGKGGGLNDPEPTGLNLPGGMAVVHHADPSHLSSNSPYAIRAAFMVVDSSRVSGTNMGALADYLAFVALAQVKSDAQAGDAPSILDLFANPSTAATPESMTAWDRSFLYALYHTRTEDMRQDAAIALHMEEALSRPGPAP
jgi:hypothetical protein